MKVKLKECAFCTYMKPIFRNVRGHGPQCLDCYKREKMSSKNYKTKAKKKAILEAYNKGFADLVEEADRLFSKVVRKSYESEEGIIFCYTCSKPMDFKTAQCGHFIPRANYPTRWLKDNCRPQCEECNVHKRGNLTIFRERLERDLPGVPAQLELLKHKLASLTRSDLINLIAELKAELK